MAAVLACGDGAALSHFSAAAHWGFMHWEERHPEVTIPGWARHVVGVRIHRARSLDRRDVLRHDSIRVTSPARTLLDLAGMLREQALRRTTRRAQAEQRVSVRQLREIAGRSHGHRGVAKLRAAMAGGAAPTRSAFEDVLVDLLDAAGIERREINAPLRFDGRTIIPDLIWRNRRIAVEADGAAWHDHRLTCEHDVDKQALLEAHGWRVLRVTWEQTVRRPRQTLARITAALEAR